MANRFSRPYSFRANNIILDRLLPNEMLQQRMMMQRDNSLVNMQKLILINIVVIEANFNNFNNKAKEMYRYGDSTICPYWYE